MKAADVKVFKASLEAMRARLRGDVSTMADAALRKTRSEASGDLSSMPIHMADIGSDAFEQGPGRPPRRPAAPRRGS
jgi:DnaK suppressor protein